MRKTRLYNWREHTYEKRIICKMVGMRLLKYPKNAYEKATFSNVVCIAQKSIHTTFSLFIPLLMII